MDMNEDLDLILSSNIGNSSGSPISLIKDDDFCSEARQFVEENACEPNLTINDFCRWINSTYKCQVSRES